MKAKMHTAILALLICASCSMEDDINYNGTMIAMVNGVEYNFNTVYGYSSFNRESRCYKPYHEIWGYNNNFPSHHYEGIKLLINDGMPTGTYHAYGTFFKQKGPYTRETYSQAITFNCEDYTMLDGDVVITSKTEYRVSGTFSFEAFRVTDYESCEGERLSVTNGYFDMSRILPRSCRSPDL